MYDIAIIGGGVNGCGIARDAAGRGPLRAARRERRPCARHLLGLDQAHPRRAALSRALRVPPGPRVAAEREVLLRMRAAHHPAAALRAAASPGAAAGLHDPRSASSSTTTSAGASILPRHHAALALARDAGRRAAETGLSQRGFEYSDCWVDDARLVVLNARDAARPRRRHPARARKSRRARRHDGHWLVELLQHASGGSETLARARAGECGRPLGWRGRWTAPSARHRARGCGWSRAATSWCRALFDHDHAYIFQNADGRIVFAHPLRAGLHADRHHRRRLLAAIPPTSRSPARRDRLSLRGGERVFRRADDARRRRLVLFGVRPLYDDGAVERRRKRRATTCSTLDARRERAAAHHLRRQDHHLPAARRGRAGEACAAFPAHARPLDASPVAAGRRLLA